MYCHIAENQIPSVSPPRYSIYSFDGLDSLDRTQVTFILTFIAFGIAVGVEGERLVNKQFYRDI
jgi:hypothetical protein